MVTVFLDKLFNKFKLLRSLMDLIRFDLELHDPLSNIFEYLLAALFSDMYGILIIYPNAMNQLFSKSKLFNLFRKGLEKVLICLIERYFRLLLNSLIESF